MTDKKTPWIKIITSITGLLVAIAALFAAYYDVKSAASKLEKSSNASTEVLVEKVSQISGQLVKINDLQTNLRISVAKLEAKVEGLEKDEAVSTLRRTVREIQSDRRLSDTVSEGASETIVEARKSEDKKPEPSKAIQQLEIKDIKEEIKERIKKE